MKDKLIIAAALLLLIAIVCTCNKCWIRPQPETKTDTVYVTVKDSTDWYTPNITVIQGGQIPQQSSKAQGVGYKVRVDSFIAYEKVYVPMEIDTPVFVSNCLAKVFYSDTSKTKYGNIIIQDTVTQNRIAARRVLTDFKFPEITKTIYEKQKRFSLGIQAGAGFTNNLKPSPYVGVGLNYSLIKF